LVVVVLDLGFSSSELSISIFLDATALDCTFAGAAAFFDAGLTSSSSDEEESCFF